MIVARKVKALLAGLVLGGVPLVTSATCNPDYGTFDFFRDDDDYGILDVFYDYYYDDYYYYDDDYYYDCYYYDCY